MPFAFTNSLLLPPNAQFIEEAIKRTLPLWYHNLHTVIVVPTALQISPVRKAIYAELNADPSQKKILLPRITTLNNWILDFPPLDDVFVGEQFARLLTICEALKQQQWLRQAFGAEEESALWGLAQTIQSLSEELSATWLPRFCQNATLSNEALADEFIYSESTESQLTELFEQGLEKIYHDLHNRVLGEEAQLLLTFWRILSGRTDPVVIRWRHLQRLLLQLQGPVIWLNSVPPTPIETLFLEQASQRVDVMYVAYQWHDASVVFNNKNEELLVLQQIWPELAKKEPLCVDIPASAASSAVWEKVSMVGCKGLEAEAHHAACTIIDWFNQGLRKIALVAQDRVVARRIRALLVRRDVPLRDETGWKLSTTRAAAALMGWFDLLSGTYPTIPESHALLDWLKSPFVFYKRAHLSAEIVFLEKNIRRYQIHGGWRNLYYATTRATEDELEIAKSVEQLLQLIQAYTSQWQNKSQSLINWCALLNDMLDGLGMRPLLLEDAAGEVLIATLDKLAYQAEQIQLHADEAALSTQTHFSLDEFRALLDLQIEQATLLDVNTSNAFGVTFLPLNGARMRTFDAVLMVGCDTKKLPAPFQENLFFSSALRTQLGLVDRSQSQYQQLCDFAELILNHRQICFSWQSQTAQGEVQEPAAWLSRLELQAKKAGIFIRKDYQSPLHFTTATPLSMPAPRAPSHRLPTQLNAHEYNALRRCPYQFFSRVILKLGVLDELDDTLEKSEIGIWLHDILWRYHSQFENQSLPTQEIESLETISNEFFSRKVAEDGHALAYWKQWQAVIPSYLAWQKKREDDGWHWDAGEITLQCNLADLATRFNMAAPSLPHLVLKGRIDRLDRHSDHHLSVLDYKVQSRQKLMQRRKNLDEDMQLPFYMLLQKEIKAAAWVALDDDNKSSDVPIEEADILAEQLAQQIYQDTNALAAGRPLPAYGKESACRFCEARGLCRKSYWS